MEIINTLFDAMKEARGLEVIGDLLNQLANYAEYHFSTEEKYFEQFGYTESELHKEEHKFLLEQVTDFKTSHDAGKIKRVSSESPITVEVWNLLKEWLIKHIQVEDKKYVTLFKERGLT